MGQKCSCPGTLEVNNYKANKTETFYAWHTRNSVQNPWTACFGQTSFCHATKDGAFNGCK